MANALASHGEALGSASIGYQEKPFTLKSGLPSHLFVDLRRGHARPALMLETGRLMLEALRGESFDTIAGTGVDGGAVVSCVLFACAEVGRRDVAGIRGGDQRQGSSAEEDPKNGWGFRRTTGKPDPEPIMEGKQVLLVEGTLTSGGSLLTLAGLIREAGGLVTAAAVVVDRSNGLLNEVSASLGTHPDTGNPLQIHALFRLDEDSRMLVPAR